MTAGAREAWFRDLDHDLVEALRARDPDIPETAHVYVLAADLADHELAALRDALTRMSTGEANVDYWIERVLPEMDIPDPAVLEQARRNAVLETKFLQELGAFTPAQVAELCQSRATNRAQAAHALRKAGRIFSVQYRGATYYPGFQFGPDGRPIPAIMDILKPLRRRFASDWQTALWFTTPNSWLAGARPADLLLDDPDAVWRAAEAGADRDGF